METARVGKVAVENTAYHFDKAYDYLIPQTLWAKAEKGCRVLVPFGGGNRTRQGLLMDVEEIRAGRTGSEEGLKSVKAVLDQTPLLSPEMLLLARWMKERYFCTLFDAVRVMLPAGLHYQVACSYQAARDIPPEKLEVLGEEEKRLIAYLSRCRLPVRRDKLLAALGYEADVDLPERMSRQGYLEKIDDAFRKIGDAMVKMVRLTEKGETGGVKLSPKQREVFSLLQTVGAASVKEVCYFTGVTAGVVDALVKKGLACCFESERYRNPYDGAPESAVKEEIVLTQEQQRAYEEQLAQYQSPDGGISLLYGVTGSGKTSVFLKLIDRAVEDKRGVILMVPEISLTPQMLALFQRRYGRQVAVFHSGLSMGERLDEWKRVKNGDALIALGTRSAVFAPFENLGLIIMDEEQEYTYKSEQAPRFHAREIAKFRCRWHRCLLTLASATPSVESYYLAQKGVYRLSTISSRYGGAKLPRVVVADMNQELLEGNTGPFSSVLMECLAENLRLRRQSILLLNRRGYHTFVSCRACGEPVTCPHCSISLTYHAANRRLMCHYCGYSIPFTDECPSCHQRQVRYAGAGTQKAEEAVEELFPEARILRMDADTTMAKYSHEKKLKQFADGEYDIMVGTQMVAKGLDFPNVTLVGVLSADQALYSDDFRSYERAFALLTQVVGRSGRGEKEGLAVIQTYTPENPVIQMAARQDYGAFFQGEIQMRKAMLYPPFADLCVVGFSGQQEENVEQAARYFTRELIALAQAEYASLPMRVIGPAKAAVPKVSGRYRYKLIIKNRFDKSFRELIARLLRQYGKQKEYAKTSVFVYINPDMIL